MNLTKVLGLRLVVVLFLVAPNLYAKSVCDGLYGKHELFHHVLREDGSVSYSEPLAIEVDLNKSGTVIIDYHLDSERVETAIFSTKYPEYAELSPRGKTVLGCKDSKLSCKEIRTRVKKYIKELDSREYLNIKDADDNVASAAVAKMRKKILSCAETLLEEVSESASRL